MTDYLEEKAARIEGAHTTERYNEAWKVVNKISGQKKSVRSQIAGSGPEERVSNWFNHLKNLLGSSRDTAGTEQDIPEILCDLDLGDGPFSTKE